MMPGRSIARPSRVAWAGYEEDLKPVRSVYEQAQATAEEAHGNAIDAAWADYKQAVANAPTTMRRDIVAQARATYNELAAQIRKTYNESMAIARDDYLRAVDDTRAAYRAAVDGELDSHRDAVRAAWSSYLQAVDSSLLVDD